MGNIGFEELVVVLLILLLIFGARKLPEIGRSIGRTVSEFKKGMREDDADKKNEDKTGSA